MKDFIFMFWKKNLQLINFPFGKSFMLEINQICFEHARI